MVRSSTFMVPEVSKVVFLRDLASITVLPIVVSDEWVNVRQTTLCL